VLLSINQTRVGVESKSGLPYSKSASKFTARISHSSLTTKNRWLANHRTEYSPCTTRLLGADLSIHFGMERSPMTIITFERSGGVVGNEVYFEVELNSLEPDQASRLMNMVEKADFFNIPSNLSMSTTPDEFHYKVTVDNGGEHHIVRATDTTMPKTLQPLVRELTMLRVLSKTIPAR
jgi:hypothetical protein